MPKALPVHHGNGREIGDITAQARHFTKDALEAIAVLLRDSETEPRLRFAVARFVLELGWGKPRAMAPPQAQTATVILDGAYEEIFNKFMEQIDGDAGDSACRPDGQLPALSGAQRVEDDSAPDAVDP